MEDTTPKKASQRIAASQSFNAEEVELLNFTYDTLLRGGNPLSVTRAKAFAGMLRKIKGMKARCTSLKAEREAAVPVAAE